MSMISPSLPFSTNLSHLTKLPLWCWCSNPIPAVSITRASASEANHSILRLEGTKERIKKLFENKVELSVSCYDTAWVAMVPQPGSPQSPCFPQCVNWLLQNQQQDGSWTHHDHDHHDLMLTKDALSSTLASVLALKKWGLGDQQITRGLQFIESNGCSITDEKQQSPIGFDIIFPGMIEYAQDMNVKLPLRPTDIEAMLRKRDLELTTRTNSEGRRAYLAYVSEGLGKLQGYEMVMKYQRKNGSLFNSPSTTAAALSVHAIQNVASLTYLHSVLVNNPCNAVPTVYPLHIYARLSMVDTLIRLGIDRHFKNEINSVLDETHKWWILGEEEILMDTATCALAFRMLREHEYDVSSDPLAPFSQENRFFNTLEGYLLDTRTILELYKASQMIMHPHESFLEQLNSWTGDFLKHQSSITGAALTHDHANTFDKHIFQELNDALELPYRANLERIAIKTNIEHYNVDSTRVLKTSYRSLHIANENFKNMAIEDFNFVHSIHRKEFDDFKRWVYENRIDKLNFPIQKLDYCYFTAAATLPSPELSYTRMSWAKNAILTTVVDDLFDTKGHQQDQIKLIDMVEVWEANARTDHLSETFEIFYLVLYNTVNEIGERAQIWQDRNVTNHIIETWVRLLKSMFREAEWARTNTVPTLDEYMANAYLSFALEPIILPALYFVGPKLSENVVQSPEMHNLFEHMSILGRLLNDIQGYQREARDGKVNAVSLRVTHSNGGVTEEEAIEEIKHVINEETRELLRMVLQKRESLVPRGCKKLFWMMSKVVHLFYKKDDGYNSTELLKAVYAVIHEPFVLNQL